MLYGLSKFEMIKLTIIVVILIAYVIITKSLPSNNKKAHILLSLCCFAAVFLVSFFPSKLLPVQYCSVEELVDTQKLGNLECMVEGESSCALLCLNGNNTELTFCNKDPNGYFLPNQVDRKIIYKSFIGNAYCYIINVPGTEDYYANIRAVSKNNCISVCDNKNSDFKGTKIVLNNDGDTTWSHYIIAYIGNSIENYSITIDGNIHSFEDVS